jgi:type IV pilus assembly protein PilO
MVGATYVPKAVLAGSAGELTEMSIDARLAGDYRPLVQFINALERDKMFFVIDGVTLNGQQSGTVNLRLRLTTYLRGGAAAEPAAAETAAAGPATGGQGQ